EKLCDTIASYGKKDGPFCRITVAGHCGGKPRPGVMLSETERFQCDSISDECGKIIAGALLQNGTLRICACGYFDKDPKAFEDELQCISKKIGGKKVCACTVQQSMYNPPAPGSQAKICTCPPPGKWICKP